MLLFTDSLITTGVSTVRVTEAMFTYSQSCPSPSLFFLYKYTAAYVGDAQIDQIIRVTEEIQVDVQDANEFEAAEEPASEETAETDGQTEEWDTIVNMDDVVMVQCREVKE